MKNRIAGAMFASIVIIMLGVMVMFCFAGCFGKKYSIDYSGDKSYYRGAKDSYRAGQKVELCYYFIATDTDYSFYLDGERINPDYDEKNGFIIRFTMPDHDVVLECRSRNLTVTDFGE